MGGNGGTDCKVHLGHQLVSASLWPPLLGSMKLPELTSNLQETKGWHKADRAPTLALCESAHQKGQTARPRQTWRHVGDSLYPLGDPRKVASSTRVPLEAEMLHSLIWKMPIMKGRVSAGAGYPI